MPSEKNPKFQGEGLPSWPWLLERKPRLRPHGEDHSRPFYVEISAWLRHDPKVPATVHTGSPDRTFRQLANRKMVPVRIFFNNSLDRKGFVAVLVQKPSKKRSLVARGRLFGFKHTLNRLIRLVFWSRDFVFVLHSLCYHLDFMNWR